MSENKVNQKVRFFAQCPEDTNYPEWVVDCQAELVNGEISDLRFLAKHKNTGVLEMKIVPRSNLVGVGSLNLLVAHIDQFVDMIDAAVEKYNQAKELLG